MIRLPDSPLAGYLEGYYGRLLGWDERATLLEALPRNEMNAWWHAPKEEPPHRLRWREPHDAPWREGFRGFCARADERGVRVVAGLAPGIDFDWHAVDGGTDLDTLVAKTGTYLADGARVPALLLDDLDDDFAARAPAGASEGATHARLANALGGALGRALVVVPRIYANELHARAPDYLADFSTVLHPEHAVALCGSDVVARTVTLADCRRHLAGAARRIVVWDNLYANDYCPRRLFVGPWTGREGLPDVFVNPTGLPATDALLLDLVGAARAGTDTPSAVRARHGVPAGFDVVAPWFDGPCCNGDPPDPVAVPTSVDEALRALDELQWRWKSPLSREWYPYLFGLRHDLLLAHGRQPPLRVAKTQTAPLADVLRERRENGE